MSRISVTGEVLFDPAAGFAIWENGEGTTAPVDIGKCTNWCIQFGVETEGAATVQTEVSAGDDQIWVPLGETYPVENGTMLVDKQVPYRFVRFKLDADPGMEITATLTMALT